MAFRFERIVIPEGVTDGALAGALNQFFALNPNITIQDLDVIFDKRRGGSRYQVSLAYESDAGGQYLARIFRDDPANNLTASDNLESFLVDNGTLDLQRVFLVTKRPKRYTGEGRLLALMLNRTLWAREVAIGHLNGQAAADIASTAVGQFIQEENPTFDRFPGTNVGGGLWPSERINPLARLIDGNYYGIGPCCAASGTDDVGTLPTPPTPPVCDNTGPPISDPLPPPPPTGSCCFIIDYECQEIEGIPTWVLINRECVNNDLCAVFQQTCDGNTYHLEIQNACTCGDPLPLPVPEPTCDPNPACSPPVIGDCCLEVEFTCFPGTDENGDCSPVWIPTNVVCQDNNLCSSGQDYSESATSVSFSERGLCLCGTTDQDVLLGLLPDNINGNNNKGFENNEPKTDPDCCPSDCCLQLEYVCQNINGTSVWKFSTAECKENDECSAALTRSCLPLGAGDANCFASKFIISQQSTCECTDKGPVTQADAEEVYPNEPPAADNPIAGIDKCLPCCPPPPGDLEQNPPVYSITVTAPDFINVVGPGPSDPFILEAAVLKNGTDTTDLDCMRLVVRAFVDGAQTNLAVSGGVFSPEVELTVREFISGILSHGFLDTFILDIDFSNIRDPVLFRVFLKEEPTIVGTDTSTII